MAGTGDCRAEHTLNGLNRLDSIIENLLDRRQDSRGGTPLPQLTIATAQWYPKGRGREADGLRAADCRGVGEGTARELGCRGLQAGGGRSNYPCREIRQGRNDDYDQLGLWDCIYTSDCAE